MPETASVGGGTCPGAAVALVAEAPIGGTDKAASTAATTPTRWNRMLPPW